MKQPNNQQILVTEFDEFDWEQLLSMEFFEEREDGKSFLRTN